MPDLTVISYGGGTQSSVLMLMAAKGLIEPMPDAAIFADPGNERPSTYRRVAWMTDQVPFPLIQVSALIPITRAVAEATDHRGRPYWPAVPMHTIRDGSKEGMARRICTPRWKIEPIITVIRSLLGVWPRKHVPRGITVEQWIGLSHDEVDRIKPARKPWLVSRWPLIDLMMDRQDCEDWWAENAPPDAPPLGKSSCVLCPLHRPKDWAELAREVPEMVEAAAEAEASGKAAEKARQRDKGDDSYLHRRRVPLLQAVAEDTRQADMAQDLFLAFGEECEGYCGV